MDDANPINTSACLKTTFKKLLKTLAKIEGCFPLDKMPYHIKSVYYTSVLS